MSQCCRSHCSREGKYRFQDLFFCHQHLRMVRCPNVEYQNTLVAQVRREILEREAGLMRQDIDNLTDDEVRKVRDLGGVPQILKILEGRA